jgi:hypothetical protein
VPTILKNKLLILIENEPFDHKYVLYLIIHAEKEDFGLILKKLGPSIICKSILDFINTAEFPERIYNLLKSPSLENLIRNKKIRLLEIMNENLDVENLFSFFHEFGTQKPELLKHLFETFKYIQNMFKDFDLDINYFINKEKKKVAKTRKTKGYYKRMQSTPRRYIN